MRIKTLVTACLLTSVTIASSVQAESLVDIYRLALDNDPKFLSSGASLEADTERGNQQLSPLLPTLSGNYNNSYNRSGSSTPTFTNFLEQVLALNHIVIHLV